MNNHTRRIGDSADYLELDSRELRDLIESMIRNGADGEEVKKVLKDKIVGYLQTSNNEIRDIITRKIDSYVGSLEGMVAFVLELVESEGIRDKEVALDKLKVELEEVKKERQEKRNKVENMEKNIQENEELAKTEVEKLEKDIEELNKQVEEIEKKYAVSKIREEFLSEILSKYNKLLNDRTVLENKLAKIEESEKNNPSPSAKRSLERRKTNLLDNLEKLENEILEQEKLFVEEGDQKMLTEVSLDSEDYKKYEELRINDKNDKINTIENQIEEFEGEIQNIKDKVEQEKETFENLKTELVKLENRVTELEPDILKQEEVLKESLNRVFTNSDFQELFKNFIKEYGELKDWYEKIGAMEDFENIFNEEALNRYLEESKRFTKSEKWFVGWNLVASLVSGAASAFGLSQTLPKVFYDWGMFVDDSGVSIDQVPVWITAIGVGGAVGIAAGKLRERIMAGISEQARKLNNRLGMVKGIANRVFGINKKGVKLATLLSGVTLVALTLGTVKPAKKPYYNFPSVPSDALGMVNAFKGDYIQKKSEAEVLDLSDKFSSQVDSIAGVLGKMDNDLKSSLDQYIQNEINGSGINGKPELGKIAQMKIFLIRGKDTAVNRKKRILINVINKLKIKYGIDENNGLNQQLDSLVEKSDLAIEANMINPEDIKTNLERILDKKNWVSRLTRSIYFNEYKEGLAKKMDSLINSIENKGNAMNEFAGTAKNLLTDIETESARIRKKELMRIIKSDKTTKERKKQAERELAELNNNYENHLEDFIPKIEKTDLSKLKELKSKIIGHIDNLDPFIENIDTASEIINPENPKLTKWLYVMSALLLEFFTILMFSPLVSSSTKKKYKKLYRDLYNEYGETINKQKVAGNLPANMMASPEEIVFSEGVEGFVEEMERVLSQVVLGVLQQLEVFPDDYIPGGEEDEIILRNIRLAIQNQYRDSNKEKTWFKKVGVWLQKEAGFGLDDSVVEERKLVEYLKNLVKDSSNIRKVVEELTLGMVNFNNDLRWADVPESEKDAIYQNILSYNIKKSDYPLDN